MGNIVSNVSSSNPQTNIGSLNGIEGVNQPQTQPAGYGVDPFGPSIPDHQPATSVGTGTTPPPATPPAAFPTSSAYPKLPDIDLPSITADTLGEIPIADQSSITTPKSESLPQEQNSAEAILNRIPDLDQMMKDLEKSGCLLPDLHVNEVVHIDTSPLAALQPDRVNSDGGIITPPKTTPDMPALPAIQLGGTNDQVLEKPTPAPELPLFIFTAVLGLVQVLQGGAQVAHFFLIRYSVYEALIMAGELTTQQMNTAVMQAVILAFAAVSTAIISIIALISRPKTRSTLFYISVFMIVLNFALQNLMARQHFASGSPLALPSIFSELFTKS